jgi:hypothetical protein
MLRMKLPSPRARRGGRRNLPGDSPRRQKMNGKFSPQD